MRNNSSQNHSATFCNNGKQRRQMDKRGHRDLTMLRNFKNVPNIKIKSVKRKE